MDSRPRNSSSIRKLEYQMTSVPLTHQDLCEAHFDEHGFAHHLEPRPPEDAAELLRPGRLVGALGHAHVPEGVVVGGLGGEGG